MLTDLARFIQETPLADTHEHLLKEDEYVQRGPDALKDIFDNYAKNDLEALGATQEDCAHLMDVSNPDVRGRFLRIREAWEKCRYTGYGEAARLVAKLAYGIEEITPEALEAAQARNRELRQPGMRLKILKEQANLDHVQVDDFCWPCLPDASGPDFFLYDLSWELFAGGEIDLKKCFAETKIEIKKLDDVREVMAAIFAKYGPFAIAVKTQHAYRRTLFWQERTDVEAASMLAKQLAGKELAAQEKLCLGDWCLARGVEFAMQYNLPVKIHTGYYAGFDRMPMERIVPSQLCGLLLRYPKARFVLMHIAYPYQHEVAALAKHFSNVYADLCWAWSIDPVSACAFVRRMIHTAPCNKLFIFGGDTHWPNSAMAYAAQARHWFTRALTDEVEEGLLKESEAIRLAACFMQKNQRACFDIDGRRANIRREITKQNDA